MGLFDKFRDGLKKTQDKLVHEIKRIVTFSPKLTEATIDELEMALIAADFGMEMTTRIVEAVRKEYESQGRGGLDVFGVARGELQEALSKSDLGLRRNPKGLTVVSVVGVNGTGKTTTVMSGSFTNGEEYATELFAVPSRDFPAPPTPLDPRLVVGLGAGVVAAVALALVLWRRRVRP